MPEVIYQKTVSSREVRLVLRRIADFFDATVTVHSGDRDGHVKGSNPRSLHRHHRAADFHVRGVTDKAVFRTLRQQPAAFFDATRGYEVIYHGPFTATGGPHMHIGEFPQGGGYVTFKLEGLTPGSGGEYDPEHVSLRGTKPIVPQSRRTVPARPGQLWINESVGRGGVNRADDVRRIQHVLNRAASRLAAAWGGHLSFELLREDGFAGTRTIAAIELFQRLVFGRGAADGRVDPRGLTLRALNEATRGPVSTVQPRIKLQHRGAPPSAPGRRRTASDNGVLLVRDSEGFRSDPYEDTSGHCTVGYGHLLHRGKCTPADKGVSRAEAEALLRRDLVAAESAVNELVKVPLNQNRFDALVSFTFNLGRQNLAESTLLRELNAGHYDKVPSELARWIHSNGKVVDGLVRRRKKEGELFNRAD